MTTNVLAPLIFEIEPTRANLSRERDGRLVIVDLRSGETFSRPPLIKLGKKLRYYRVRTDVSSIEARGPVCEILGRTYEERLELEIRYRATVRCGQEEKLALGLASVDRPDHALHALLRRWVSDWADANKQQGVDLFHRGTDLLAEIEAHLEKRSRSELGLNLQVYLRVRGEDLSDSLEIHLKGIRIHVRDADESQELDISARLDVFDASRALRNPDTVVEWQGLLEPAIRDWVSTEIGFHEFTFELRGDVQERLRAHLDATVLRRAGRRLGLLKLEAQDPGPMPPGSHRLKENMHCNVRDTMEEVKLETILRVELEDLGRFQRSGVEDLDVWLRERVVETARSHLFELGYRDLLREFTPGSGQGPEILEQSMASAARGIGYALRQMTVIPELTPLKWLDGIHLEIEKEGLATGDDKVRVGLIFVVHGRVRDIYSGKIERYLDPQRAKAFEGELERRIVQTASRPLHQMDPERVYMRFLRSTEADERPVVEVLHDAIRQMLIEEFAFAPDLEVVVKPGHTDLTERAEELQRRPQEVELEVVAHAGQGNRERVPFRILYQILGVDPDGWHLFRARRLDSAKEHLKEIERVLQATITARFDTVAPVALQYADEESQNYLRTMLEETREAVRQTFGLVISFISFHRESTKGETARLDSLSQALDGELEGRKIRGQSRIEHQKKHYAGLLRELGVLQEKRDDYLDKGVDPEEFEVAAISRRIREIQEEMAASDDETLQSPMARLERPNLEELAEAKTKARLPSAEESEGEESVARGEKHG